MAAKPASPFTVLILAAVIMATVTVCTGERRCNDGELDVGLYCMNSLRHPDSPKVPPSGRCCEAVRRTDVKCLCSFVDEQYEKGVSMEKLVYVMRACHKPLKPGCKCGIYTVPPSSGHQGGDC